MKIATVIRQIAFEDLGSLEEVLIKAQYHITMLDAGLDDLTKIDQAKTDLLIVLGGPIGVYDKTDYPFLETEEKLLKERIEQKRPTIGICLGAQLKAMLAKTQ